MTVQIPLTKGYCTIVDDEDADYAKTFKWQAFCVKDLVYALRTTYPRGSEFLHRAIMGDPAGMVIDHADGNGLNNVRANLRICTQRENMRNKRKTSGTASAYKGVYAEYGKWRARIFDKRLISLGVFTSEIEAAVAYDDAAVRLFGNYSRINFPERHPHSLDNHRLNKHPAMDACLVCGDGLPGPNSTTLPRSENSVPSSSSIVVSDTLFMTTAIGRNT